MSLISNRLIIDGVESDVEVFLKDHQRIIPHIGNIKCNGNVLKFLTKFTAPFECFQDIRLKYPLLKFTLFWVDKDDITYFGMIDADGEKYEITGKEDYKLAGTWLKQLKNPPPAPKPIMPPKEIPRLKVVPRGEGMFEEEKHHLAIKMCEQGKFVCMGFYKNKSRKIFPLTPEKIEICQQYRLDYFLPTPNDEEK